MYESTTSFLIVHGILSEHMIEGWVYIWVDECSLLLLSKAV